MHFVESFHAKWNGRKSKICKTDADVAYSVFSLTTFEDELAHISQTMRVHGALGDNCMPIEMESIILEVYQTLPQITASRDTKMTKVRGLVQSV